MRHQIVVQSSPHRPVVMLLLQALSCLHDLACWMRIVLGSVYILATHP